MSRHQRLGATIAKDSGVVLPGASMSRQMGTKDGDKHVKFAWIGGGEGPYSPANEALGAALLELMGIERPMRWVVQVPDGLAAATPEFASLRSKFGLGTDWLPEWGIELTDGQIVAAAAGAPLDELLAQHAVMTWVQVGDHSHNFVQYDKRVIAVDFASGPPTAVWDGGSLGTDVTDHAGLSSLLAAASEETRSAITDRFDAITVADLQEILDELPESWVTRDQCNHVGSELLRTKGATRVVLEP